MLPKLQQSSLANTLRRDNLASQIQCTPSSTKARTNCVEFLANRTMSPISHGRTNMPQKIHTVPSEISRRSTFPRKSSRTASTSLSMNSLSLDPLPNTPNRKALEARLPALSKKRQSSKNQCQNQGHSRREMCQLLNFAGIMIVEIYQFESITKTLCQSWCGRYRSSRLTTIIIYPFSLTGHEKNSTLIALSPFLAPTICWIKAATRSFL